MLHKIKLGSIPLNSKVVLMSSLLKVVLTKVKIKMTKKMTIVKLHLAEKRKKKNWIRTIIVTQRRSTNMMKNMMTKRRGKLTRTENPQLIKVKRNQTLLQK